MAKNEKDNMRAIHPHFQKVIQQSSTYILPSTQDYQTATNNLAPL